MLGSKLMVVLGTFTRATYMVQIFYIGCMVSYFTIIVLGPFISLSNAIFINPYYVVLLELCIVRYFLFKSLAYLTIHTTSGTIFFTIYTKLPHTYIIGIVTLLVTIK